MQSVGRPPLLNIPTSLLLVPAAADPETGTPARGRSKSSEKFWIDCIELELMAKLTCPPKVAYRYSTSPAQYPVGRVKLTFTLEGNKPTTLVGTSGRGLLAVLRYRRRGNFSLLLSS